MPLVIPPAERGGHAALPRRPATRGLDLFVTDAAIRNESEATADAVARQRRKVDLVEAAGTEVVQLEEAARAREDVKVEV